MTNPQTNSALLMRLNSLRPNLSKAEQKVVDYTLQDPEEVIHLSVSGLAEISGVSEATVVRACRSMGFDGYQDFKVTLAQSIVTPLQSIHEDIAGEDSIEVMIDKIFQGTIHTLNFTHDAIKASAIESAVDAIMNAENVYVFGLGNSNAIACDLQHKLLRLGIKATAYTDSHLQSIIATHATEKDVVFAVSHSGSSIDVIYSSQIAKEHGATIISLTNIGSSPLSKISDIKLYTASSETKYRIVAMSSRIAQMAIIDTLYTIIAARTPEIAENFHNIEKALEVKKY